MRKVRKGRIALVIVLLLIVVGGVAFIVLNKKDNTKEMKKDEVKTTEKEEEKKLDYNEKITIKIGDDIPICKDFIEACDENITWIDEFENNKTLKAGTYNGVFKYKNFDYNVSVIVVDDEAPKITGVKDLSTNVGVKIDLLKNINVTDNSTDKVSVNVVGNYDFNKEGAYNLLYEAKDSSENVVQEKFTLKVIKKEVVTSNQSNTNVPEVKTGVSSKGYEIKRTNGAYYIGGILVANKSYDLSSSYNPGGLTATFNNAFSKMKTAAAKDGVTLTVISGFRSYSTQNTLYNNYVARDGKAAADRYSARPGHSEHQTGLAADLNQISDTFGETKAGKWLSANCWKYGFILRYPKGKESITGYMYESWHFRYIGDTKITETIYNNGSWLTLEEYLGIDSKYK